MPRENAFRLQTQLAHFNKRYTSHVVSVPTEVAEALGGHGTRVKGTLNGVGYRLALMNTKDGEYYLSTNQKLRKKARLSLGEPLELYIKPDPRPDHVEVGEAFEALLEEDPDLNTLWGKQTAGFRRSLAHYLLDAKREETQIKRALEVARRLLAGDFDRMRR